MRQLAVMYLNSRLLGLNEVLWSKRNIADKTVRSILECFGLAESIRVGGMSSVSFMCIESSCRSSEGEFE